MGVVFKYLFIAILMSVVFVITKEVRFYIYIIHNIYIFIYVNV